MKNYTAEQLNKMNLAEVEQAMADIENAGWYISAEMADRLHGTEREDYEQAKRTLTVLATRRYNLRKDTKEYKEECLAIKKKYLNTKEKNLENGFYGCYGKVGLLKDIQELREEIAKAEREIAAM